MSSVQRRVAIVVVGLVAVTAISIIGWFAVRPGPDLVQGEVEATEIKVSSKIPARVVEISVREGDSVRFGETLVTLSSPEIDAKLDQAQAAQRAAAAQSDKADAGPREEEIRRAHTMWLRAVAAADLADTTFERVNRLYHDGVVAEQRRDEAEANSKASRQAANAARALYDMASTGARTEDRRAAAALESQAAGAVTEVRAYLDETSLRAPHDGEVSVVVAEAGELVAPGFPIVTIIDLSDIWVTFNVREDRLFAIRIGSRLTATVPALGNEAIELEVFFISPQGDFATWRATSASGEFDLKTFELRARPVQPTEGLRPGMTVVVDWDAAAAR
ncbi:MAG: efflux RND transporter periplasmic adaptor subunit [Acidobacteriota bacterium]|nr:efflux RND transporter periplasmic adaptor subunit [Acidobacteriota bacterium]